MQSCIFDLSVQSSRETLELENALLFWWCHKGKEDSSNNGHGDENFWEERTERNRTGERTGERIILRSSTRAMRKNRWSMEISDIYIRSWKEETAGETKEFASFPFVFTRGTPALVSSSPGPRAISFGTEGRERKNINKSWCRPATGKTR